MIKVGVYDLDGWVFIGEKWDILWLLVFKLVFIGVGCPNIAKDL